MKRFVILHNIRSAHNVGAVFRTADGAGIEKIYLVGYTPTPEDRFGREQQEIMKTSLGATKTVTWEHREDIEELIEDLQKEGVAVVAVEQDSRAIDYRAHDQRKDTAFMFGNEVDGVSPELCGKCDAIVEIPMYGVKESLNVSVTAGVILFNIR